MNKIDFLFVVFSYLQFGLPCHCRKRFDLLPNKISPKPPTGLSARRESLCIVFIFDNLFIFNLTPSIKFLLYCTGVLLCHSFFVYSMKRSCCSNELLSFVYSRIICLLFKQYNLQITLFCSVCAMSDEI